MSKTTHVQTEEEVILIISIDVSYRAIGEMAQNKYLHKYITTDFCVC